MNDSASDNIRTRKPLQKPVFIINPFDASNTEHMRGNMTLTLNKRFATDLCRLIKECELSEDEGYLFAIQGNIQRWYKQRFDEINKLKEVKAVSGAVEVKTQ